MHALSIPTWMIHISSVIEWGVAMWLIWTYANAIRNPAWKTLAIAMFPALISAMCACTWHFFDNPPTLEWLVTLQAAMTLIGNSTLCLAAWWIWRSGRSGQRLTQAVPSSSLGAQSQRPTPTTEIAKSTPDSSQSCSLE